MKAVHLIAALAAWTAVFVPARSLDALELTHTEWTVVFEEDLAHADVLNHWQVVRGRWSATPDGLRKLHDAQDAVLMLRLPVVTEAVRVEYEVTPGPAPGDASLIMGTADGAVEHAVFFGLGSGDNTFNRLSVRNTEVARAPATPLRPGVRTKITALREEGRLELMMDDRVVLSAPDAREGYAGRYLALYAWNEIVFHTLRVSVRRDDVLYAHLRVPRDWREWRHASFNRRISDAFFEFGAFAESMRQSRAEAIRDTVAMLPAGYDVRKQDSWVAYGDVRHHTVAPSLVALDDGSLLAVASGKRLAYDGPDGAIILLRSRDGLRWSDPVVIAETVLDDRDPGLTVLSDGALAVTWRATDEYRSEAIATAYPHWIRSLWTERWQGLKEEERNNARGNWMITSRDGGMSWSAPARVPVAPPHGLTQLRDGRLVGMGREEGPPAALVVYASEDRGNTWVRLWRREAAFRLHEALNNAHIAEVEPGRLVAMLSHEHPAVLYRRHVFTGDDRDKHWGEHTARGMRSAGHLWYMESPDGGVTWSEPDLTDLYGSHPHLAVLSDGRLLCSYSHHGLPFGPRAAVSDNRGTSWRPQHETILRVDAPTEHPGSPSTVPLDDQRLLTLYAQSIAEYEQPRTGPALLHATLWAVPDRFPPAPRFDVAASVPVPARDRDAIERDRRSAPALLEIRDVLIADGRDHYRIPSIVATPSGAVLVFANRRIDTVADEARENDVVVTRSLDGGRTWHAPHDIFSRPGWSAIIGTAMVDDLSGRIFVNYSRRPAFDHIARRDAADPDAPAPGVFMAVSDDDGVTWQDRPVTFQPHPSGRHAYTHGCGPGITLSSGPHRGRLVMPAILAPGSPEDDYRSCVVYSDDRGETWITGGMGPDGTNECTVVETQGGVLYLNSRVHAGDTRPQGYRRFARSIDGGATFTAFGHDDILTEHLGGCNAALQRLAPVPPGDDDPLPIVFSNPARRSAITPGFTAWGENVRQWMTIRLSYDGGRTWPVARRLERSMSAYSAMAALPDGTVLCSYERGTHHPYERIAVARFNLPWLLEDMPESAPDVRR